MACQAFETTGDLPAARQHAELVITLRDGNHARSRAFGQLRLAGSLLAQGEVDHACANGAGRLLLVNPNYKPDWDVPGGMAETAALSIKPRSTP